MLSTVTAPGPVYPLLVVPDGGDKSLVLDPPITPRPKRSPRIIPASARRPRARKMSFLHVSFLGG